MARCYNCMQEIEDGTVYCPHCGYQLEQKQKDLYYLDVGTLLSERRYMIGVPINAGGFGIVYKAWDQTFGKMVAIKEFFPSSIATRIPETNEVRAYSPKNEAEFEKGKKRFLGEARKMAKFNEHPNIVDVYDFFEENDTVYMVMEYMDGVTYKEYIREQGGKVSLELATAVSLAVLDALKEVHKAKIIHRDINPNNIFICRSGVVKLFDFGAARFEQTDMSTVLTPHYAPPEQYRTKSKQGAQTDIYAVGATMYFALTGIKPEESTDRQHKDKLVPPMKLNNTIPKSISNAIIRAMALKPELRFKNAADFQKALQSMNAVRDVEEEIKRRRLYRFAQAGVITVIFAAGAGVCWQMYHKEQVKTTLQKAELEVWLSADEDDTEETVKERFDAMLADFKEQYPQVELDVRVYPESEYEDVLNQAAKDGELPEVFDSTLLDEAYFDELEPLDTMYQMIENPLNYYMLFGYEQLFPEKKQMPLCLQAAVVYKRSDLEAADTYAVRPEDSFIYENLKQKDNESAAKGDQQELNAQDALNAFLEGTIAEYDSDTRDYQFISKQIPGRFEVTVLENSVLWPDHWWSVNASSSKEQKKAAEWMIYYMLSDRAQSILTVQGGEGVPLSHKIGTVFLDVYQGDLEKIDDTLSAGTYADSEWMTEYRKAGKNFKAEITK